ncbi:MAG: DUF2334 domain-containing protein [Nanoarchaeota archaeon]
MVVIDIHLEGIERRNFLRSDRTRLLREILYRNVPVVLSLPPWMEDYWNRKDSKVIDLVSEIVSRDGNVLGQQGNTHKCPREHVLVDPWHENYCIWRGGLSEEQQRELMETGRERLEKLIGVKPMLYVPPNHQSDWTTLRVANKMGYWYMVDKAMIPLRPYASGNLIVVPEGDLRREDMRSAATYIHYDEIDRHRVYYSEAVRAAQPVAEIEAQPVSGLRIAINSALKYSSKAARDIVRMPGRVRNLRGDNF